MLSPLERAYLARHEEEMAEARGVDLPDIRPTRPKKWAKLRPSNVIRMRRRSSTGDDGIRHGWRLCVDGVWRWAR